MKGVSIGPGGLYINNLRFADDTALCGPENEEIARNTFLAMKDLFKDRKVKFALRFRLVNLFVWSVLLYGAET